jgi:hypothetical protein
MFDVLPSRTAPARCVPTRPVPARRTSVAAVAVLGLALAGAAEPARAQARLEAGYTISVARIPIGSATSTGNITDSEYTLSMSGRASGAMRVLSSGDGSLLASGSLKDGRPVPLRYTSTTTSDDDTLDVKMTFEDGNVKDLTASPPPPSPDRVALTEAHRQAVVDPLTALLVPAADGGDGLTPAVCGRVLAIFDGRRRYDLKLAFKRIERVKADKGYAGPVVVCSMVFQPLAGHRASSTLMKFLTEGREMELAFAPIAGTRLLAPFRVTITHMLGNLVVQANRFEALPPASAPASTAAEPAK